MHEYSVAQQIIKMAEKACLDANAGSVRKISIVAGRYSGFIGESISMYFDIISEGTLCEGAAIEIEPAETGKEFYIKEIEVE